MSKTPDKFEATRIVTDTIKEFEPKDQEMIFRWAAESLGLRASGADRLTTPGAAPTPSTAPASRTAQDIQSFVKAKSPRSDVQFATTVAYYYQFEAPESERKTSISESDLVDACRKVGRERPQKPYFTLNNAFHAGLLDRPEKGTFAINAVGENLVALTLPSQESNTNGRKRPKKAPNGRKTSTRSRA